MDIVKEIESIVWLENANHIKSVLETEFGWKWLPTSRDQENPFQEIEEKTDDTNEKEELNKIYKITLKSLRSLGSSHPKLVYGANNYTEAFKGAALFACREAAKEALSNKQGKWQEIFLLYKKGRWPCGLKENGDIVLL